MSPVQTEMQEVLGITSIFHSLQLEMSKIERVLHFQQPTLKS